MWNTQIYANYFVSIPSFSHVVLAMLVAVNRFWLQMLITVHLNLSNYLFISHDKVLEMGITSTASSWRYLVTERI